MYRINSNYIKYLIMHQKSKLFKIHEVINMDYRLYVTDINFKMYFDKEILG